MLFILFPIGGGGILNELAPVGFIGGGAMLNEEYGLPCLPCEGGGAMAGKLEKELVWLEAVFVAAEILPHVFEEAIDEPALLQSMLELCVLAPYEGVGVLEVIMLFMLMTGRTCCCCGGGAKEELPMPGFAALSAGKDVLSVLSVLSGVTARLCCLGAERLVLGGGDTGAVDHEKVAAGDALFDRLADGREGGTVDDAADAEPFAQGSPPSMSVPPDAPCLSPRTSASKSVSPFPLLVSKPLVFDGPPKVINSFRVVAVALFAPSSCSLRVCSFSTRADVVLMRLMYA
ncbi:Protein kinase domain-containing protein ppk32 [Pyrenophora tritici-repentis]|nr:Protein kinase domain-containing protein ppk32 [Pyrenophora tritici-repentis]